MNDVVTPTTNRKIILAARPTGMPNEETLKLETAPIGKPGKGQMLVRSHYLSLDPYMRGMMSDRDSYAEPIPLGGTMVGGTVAEVVESQLDGYATGDWVMTYGGWQDYAISDGSMTFGLDPAMENKSWALGILGMPGLTAWAGLREIGKPKPGETLVVAAAVGPVGSAVGQFAKKMGLRVVGVAGGAEKCRIAVKELGFDACIDHRAPDFEAQLKAAVPDGIDIYFENVGGRVFRAVVPLLNERARIPLCGNIVTYNNPDQPTEGLPDHTDIIMAKFQQYRVLAQGFLVSDYLHLWSDFHAEVAPWLTSGEVRYVEDISNGLEAAPQGLRDVLSGANIGKKVIRLTA
ncbi:MAG: NADP-dependent oxidoreductase [Kaistia sp. SCN 65-12]|nr:MAG: NADP-dependent oxidoreductase [Kaistia sp. SCN 65-12]